MAAYSFSLEFMVDCPSSLYTVWVLLLVTWMSQGTSSLHILPVTSTEHFHNRTTSGKSGVVCTGIKRRCLKDLLCENKRCLCPPGYKGNGQIECVQEQNLLCTVSADPHLKGYRGARADVDLPCRYRLTRFVTDHRSAATPHAYCSVEVYATNELNKGRYYVRSVHISLGITDSGQQVHDQFEVRKFGVSDEQIYKFLASVKKTRTLWGFSQHEEINGVDVFPIFDKDNNFAVLTVPECGIRVKYRAYEPTKHRQHLLPGISIMAPPDIKIVKGYGYYPHSLCGTDTDDHMLYSNRTTDLGLTNEHFAIIYDILDEGAPQKGNPKKAECEAAIQVFKDTDKDDRVNNINLCGPILVNMRTRKCTIKAGVQPIVLFTACLRHRHQPNTADCLSLQTVRQQCGKKWKGMPVSC